MYGAVKVPPLMRETPTLATEIIKRIPGAQRLPLVDLMMRHDQARIQKAQRLKKLQGRFTVLGQGIPDPAALATKLTFDDEIKLGRKGNKHVIVDSLVNSNHTREELLGVERSRDKVAEALSDRGFEVYTGDPYEIVVGKETTLEVAERQVQVADALIPVGARNGSADRPPVLTVVDEVAATQSIEQLTRSLLDHGHAHLLPQQHDPNRSAWAVAANPPYLY